METRKNMKVDNRIMNTKNTTKEITVKDILKVAQDKRSEIRRNRIKCEIELDLLEDKKKQLTTQNLSDMSAYVKLERDIASLRELSNKYKKLESGAQEITDVLIKYIFDNGIYDAKIITKEI